MSPESINEIESKRQAGLPVRVDRLMESMDKHVSMGTGSVMPSCIKSKLYAHLYGGAELDAVTRTQLEGAGYLHN